ncbi:hypothetical protein, partial [Klebsiella quasipneumoniae]|uniref:hypothetical protein n=1 Tax=Klebsiella quasipneumoniae TaxID=1463165 RepID=UPI00296E4DA5
RSDFRHQQVVSHVLMRLRRQLETFRQGTAEFALRDLAATCFTLLLHIARQQRPETGAFQWPYSSIRESEVNSELSIVPRPSADPLNAAMKLFERACLIGSACTNRMYLKWWLQS